VACLPYRLLVLGIAGILASFALPSCTPTDWETDDIAPASCQDDRRNGAETDIDCGGSECEKCVIGGACLTASDCVSGECHDGICQEPHCSNVDQDEDEEGVDCGGKDCPPCGGSDSCANHRKDQNETDVDCGGPSDCDRCQAGDSCESDGDCLSDVCLHSVCRDDGTGTGGASPVGGSSGGGGRSAGQVAGAGGEDASAAGAPGFDVGGVSGESGGNGAFAGAPSLEGGAGPATGGTAEKGGSENTGGRPATGGAAAGGSEASGGAGGRGGATGSTGGRTGGTGGSTGGSTGGTGGSTGGTGGSTGGTGGSTGGTGGSTGGTGGSTGGTGGSTGGTGGTGGSTGGTGGTGGSSTSASGVAVLTVPLTAVGQGQRYNYQNYDGVGSYDLTGATLIIVAYAPDAIGGNLHVFFTTPDRVDSPAVDVALSTLTTGFQTVSIPVPGALNGFNPATIMVTRIEVEAGSGFGTTWQTPATVVYIDGISTSNGPFDDTFATNEAPLAHSGARSVSGATITWLSNYPP
jgi:hypothetical protein